MIDNERLCCMFKALRRQLNQLAAAVAYGKLPPQSMDRIATQYTSSGNPGSQIVGSNPRRRSITFIATGIGVVNVAPDSGSKINIGVQVPTQGQPLAFKYVEFPVMVTGAWIDLSPQAGNQVAVFEEIVTE